MSEPEQTPDPRFLADPASWGFLIGYERGRTQLNEVRCRSCGRFLGLTHRVESVAMYCDDDCALEFPGTGEWEQRDAIVAAIAEQPDTPSRLRIGDVFGISRQRVDQIVKKARYQTLPRYDQKK